TEAIRAWEKEQMAEAGADAEPRKRLPIVALTANAVVGVREMFLKKGFDDFLAKPIDISKLDEMLGRWISKEKRHQNSEGLDTRDQDADSGFSLGIPGIDTAKGMAMTGGTESGYRQVLSMFRKDAVERLPILRAVPEADTLSMFVTQVHALKSASAVLGASGISAKAAALEAAGKDGDMAFIRKNLPGFALDLTDLTDRIRAWEISEKPDAPGETDMANAMPLLRELALALKSGKASSDIFPILDELNLKPLASETREALEKISDDVLMTEYDSATETIEKLIAATKE
ncbi:MAG: Hpt domain-containing protein, partial [Treponema sp.]|nr:Hpt domain-containing protein [Treponema sp.]